MGRSSQVCLDELRIRVDVDLAQDRVAGINESMRRVSRDDDDAACSYLSVFIADGDGGAAFEGECDFDVGMLMQGRTLSGPGLDDVGREGRALHSADELIRHSNKRQLLETDEAHAKD